MIEEFLEQPNSEFEVGGPDPGKDINARNRNRDGRMSKKDIANGTSTLN